MARIERYPTMSDMPIFQPPIPEPEPPMPEPEPPTPEPMQIFQPEVPEPMPIFQPEEPVLQGGMSGQSTDGAPYSALGSVPFSSEQADYKQAVAAQYTAGTDKPIEPDPIVEGAIKGAILAGETAGAAATGGAAGIIAVGLGHLTGEGVVGLAEHPPQIADHPEFDAGPDGTLLDQDK
jgi:hypothetical protein